MNIVKASWVQNPAGPVAWVSFSVLLFAVKEGDL